MLRGHLKKVNVSPSESETDIFPYLSRVANKMPARNSDLGDWDIPLLLVSIAGSIQSNVWRILVIWSRAF